MIELIKVIVVFFAIGVFVKAIKIQYKINKEIQNKNESAEEINTDEIIYFHVHFNKI